MEAKLSLSCVPRNPKPNILLEEWAFPRNKKVALFTPKRTFLAQIWRMTHPYDRVLRAKKGVFIEEKQPFQSDNGIFRLLQKSCRP